MLFSVQTLIFVVTGVSFFVSLLQLNQVSSRLVSLSSPTKVQTQAGPFDSTRNQTLGFEKIFVVSLPERSDRRDGMTVQAAVSGMEIDFVNGYSGENIYNNVKALPYGYDRKAHKEHHRSLGCWRGHMDAAQRIIQQNLTSALIMEDDTDWDIHLKDTLPQFAQGVRLLQGESPTDMLNSPYGNDWDILWLGHCGEKLGKGPHYAMTDETVPATKNPQNNNNNNNNNNNKPPSSSPPLPLLSTQSPSQYPPHTRIIQRAQNPVCLFGYALSQRGARKMIYSLSMDRMNAPIDWELSDLCQGRNGRDKLDMKCYSALPSYIGTHRAKGDESKDTDNGVRGVGRIRRKGVTEGVRWSVRLNLEALLKGGVEGKGGELEDGYPD